MEDVALLFTSIVLASQREIDPVHSPADFHPPHLYEVRPIDLESFERACDDELRALAFFLATSSAGASLWLTLLLASPSFSEVGWAAIFAIALTLSSFAFVFGLMWLFARWWRGVFRQRLVRPAPPAPRSRPKRHRKRRR